MEVVRSWGKGELFDGYGVSVQDNEKVLEMGNVDGCTTM